VPTPRAGSAGIASAMLEVPIFCVFVIVFKVIIELINLSLDCYILALISIEC